MQYISVSGQAAKDKIPGSAYVSKILQFFKSHYKVGDLYMEFLKASCKTENKQCDFCDTWTGIPIKRVPQPCPDVERPGHFMDVSMTPSHSSDGTERSADDWQPRANLSRLFNNNELSLKDQDKITDFSVKFCVKKEYVISYLQHLTNLKMAREIQSRDRKRIQLETRDKRYDEYDWTELVLKGKLQKLKIFGLDKYLDKNQLNKRGKKDDKIRAISADVLRKNTKENIKAKMRNALNEECDKIDLVDDTDSFESSDISEIEDNSDDDLIMDTIETDSDLDDDQDSMGIGFNDEQDDRIADPAPYVVQTRYGKHCGSWNLFQMN